LEVGEARGMLILGGVVLMDARGRGRGGGMVEGDNKVDGGIGAGETVPACFSVKAGVLLRCTDDLVLVRLGLHVRK